MTTITNLDRLAAQHAQEIIASTKNQKAKDIENTVTKTLGVLQEDGAYACFLYLLAREKENGKAVVTEMLNLLDRLDIGWGKPNSDKAEDILSHLIQNEQISLEQLFLTKETLEQMLIYARYGAKARAAEEKQEDKNKDGQNQEETP